MTPVAKLYTAKMAVAVTSEGTVCSKSFASLHFFFKMYEVGEVEGFLFIHFLKLDWITGIKIKFKPQ